MLVLDGPVLELAGLPPLDLSREMRRPAPAYDPSDLYGIVSADDRIPFDALEIVARLVDGSKFSPFKPEWGESILCGFTRIWGHLVGERTQPVEVPLVVPEEDELQGHGRRRRAPCARS